MKILFLSLFLFNCCKDIIKVDTKLSTGWYYINSDNKKVKRQLDKTTDYYYIDPNPIVTAKDIEKIDLRVNTKNKTYILMQFDSIGTKAWSSATAKSIGNRLGFVLNDKLIQLAVVNAEITGGISAIWDDYNKTEMELIKMEIEKNKSEYKTN